VSQLAASQNAAVNSQPEATRPQWLTAWEKRGLIAFVVLLIVLGAVTVKRSAFMSRRMGDFGVYVRAGWAVRAGEDIYVVPDDTRFHYNYPPLLAILMVPLADPPPGADRTGMVPFAVSVAIGYALSLVCLFLAVHWLASALEATSKDPAVRDQPRGCRRWWALRILPVLVCLVPIGHTLTRGQMNLLLLMLLCAALAATVRGRRFQGGLWLAGAICLKIFPAFLLLFPVCRRDGRFLLGCAAGLILGLVIIPAAVFGPIRAWNYYDELSEVLIRPALGGGSDQSRAHELTSVTATDSQSLMATLHNTLHLDQATRPPQASQAVRLISGCVGAALTLLALLAAGWRGGRDPVSIVLFFGALVLNMILLSPVCHLHYFTLMVPLVMALLVVRWEKQNTLRLGTGLAILFTVFLIANTLPQFPGQELVRDGGLAMYAALLVWAVSVAVLWKRTRRPDSDLGERPHLPLAA
jgi:hypothetical protein